MNQIRKRLTYANVMSSIAVFLVLGGATAVAARKIGTKQIRANAVTTGKIKKNAVTKAKIKNGAVDGSKIADGSVTNAELSPTTNESFARVVERLRGTVRLPFTAGQIYPLNNASYTQQAGVDNQLIGGLEVNFSASCTSPRSAIAYMLLDAERPTAPMPQEIVGIGQLIDRGAGSVNRMLNFAPFAGFGPSSLFGPSSATGHTISFLMVGGSCTAGSGIDAIGAGVDVIGVR